MAPSALSLPVYDCKLFVPNLQRHDAVRKEDRCLMVPMKEEVPASLRLKRDPMAQSMCFTVMYLKTSGHP